MLIKFFLPLFLFSLSAAAQTSYLRLIGTNLYDFSTQPRPYFLNGTVVKTYPKSIQVSLKIGTRMTFEPDPIYLYTTGHPRDNLRALAMLRHGPPTSAGQAFAMGLPGQFTPVEVTTTIYLLNHPPVAVGDSINCYAVPTSTPQFWDCGIPFSGNISNYTVIYRVLTNGIRVDRLKPVLPATPIGNTSTNSGNIIR